MLGENPVCATGVEGSKLDNSSLFRRCISEPSLRRDQDLRREAMDVFLASREFNSWAASPTIKLLPRRVKEAVLDMGICHYMVSAPALQLHKVLTF